MPRIDYKTIRNTIKEVIDADQGIENLTVYASNVAVDNILQPHCIITLLNRIPHSNQPIAAGTKVRYNITGSIVVMTASLEQGIAEDLRDEYLSRIEVALMRNRKLDGLITTLQLEGGELATGFDDKTGYYASGGEVVITIDADITI